MAMAQSHSAQWYTIKFDAHVQWGCKPTDAILMSLAGACEKNKKHEYQLSTGQTSWKATVTILPF